MCLKVCTCNISGTAKGIKLKLSENVRWGMALNQKTLSVSMLSKGVSGRIYIDLKNGYEY